MMTGDYTYRIAMIVPAAQVEAARRVSASLGWGEGCFSVPLSDTGFEPATHYGLSTSATQLFVDDLTAASDGTAPEGVDPADLAAVMPVLAHQIGAATRTDPIAQFEGMASAHALMRVAPEDPGGAGRRPTSRHGANLHTSPADQLTLLAAPP